MKNFISPLVTLALLAGTGQSMPTVQKRSQITGNCSGDQTAKIQEALASCSRIAGQAAEVAMSSKGDVLFQAFFKSSDQAVKKNVADRFKAIAAECNSGYGGKVNLQCDGQQTIPGGTGCGGMTYGVSYPGKIYLCPHFYKMPVEPKTCNGFTNNRACAMIHELTHRDEVFAPGTKDTYGVDQILRLDGASARNMADTYSLFALYASKGCKPPKAGGNFYEDNGADNNSGGNPYLGTGPEAGPGPAPAPVPAPNPGPDAGGRNLGGSPPTSGYPPVQSPPTGNAPPSGSPPTKPYPPANTPPVENTPPQTGGSPDGNSSPGGNPAPVCYNFDGGNWGPATSRAETGGSGGSQSKASICYEFVNGQWTTKGARMADGSKW